MRRIILSFFVFIFLQADVFDVITVSKAGMNVQQQKMQAIAENIANINTSKTIGGGPYYKKTLVVKTNRKNNTPYVASVQQSVAMMQRIYDPANADADEEGYVYISNSSLSQEMVDMATVRRLYEANAAVFSSAKQMAQTVMNLGK
ncbi:MAG: hypothetical protein A2Y40_04050 [Candidatus Margulisbacteria bacterium GWF2_35_9]|nr:MAG: hypothetical protein A2Y40_04050 [Candidatus Margulisbacteria bacterium GWF2_35_9]